MLRLIQDTTKITEYEISLLNDVKDSIEFWNSEKNWCQIPVHTVRDRQIMMQSGNEEYLKEKRLEMVARTCKEICSGIGVTSTFSNRQKNGYRTGLSGSHVWVSRPNGDRIFIVG